jgi:hypothetical protein
MLSTYEEIKEKIIPLNAMLAFEFIDGKIKVKYQAADGTILYKDQTILPSGIYAPISVKWHNILLTLEEMINDPTVNEYNLQAFFESHKDLLKEDEFDMVIHQAVIHRDNESSIKPDFVLVPKDQELFSKILELKLPSAQFTYTKSSNKIQPYKKLLEAIQQTRKYGEALKNSNSQKKFHNKYGVSPFKPKLQLVYGRKEGYEVFKRELSISISTGLAIENWDELLDKMRKRMT